jgi:hypothetical protein
MLTSPRHIAEECADQCTSIRCAEQPTWLRSEERPAALTHHGEMDDQVLVARPIGSVYHGGLLVRAHMDLEPRCGGRPPRRRFGDQAHLQVATGRRSRDRRQGRPQARTLLRSERSGAHGEDVDIALARVERTHCERPV